MKNLDHKIQEIAATEWETFAELVGPAGIIKIKARMLRQGGKSWQQISVMLDITLQEARTACKDLKKTG